MTDRCGAVTAHRPAGRVDRADVRAARRRMTGRIRKTPVFHTSVAGPDGPVPVTLKLEYLQHGGTFKVRGSLNALLASSARTDQVVIASAGNAGIAAALAASWLGKACTVVVPESAPHTKVAAMWSHGAEVLWHGTTYGEAVRHAAELAEERGAFSLHAFDLPDVAAGAGVVGLELEEQVRGKPPVLVTVGGGGLVAGIGAALGRRQRVIGVEPVELPALHAALIAGEPVEVGRGGLGADALGATRIGELALDVARRYDVPSLLVTEEAVAASREYLWREFRIVVESAGASALAAIQSGAYIPEPGERPVVVLCGANTDLTAL
ncbi:serine/threonine dehydratase [Nocardia puris]|uniref:serine/threonine dehydratase n=1 Tax=Nocardia puris TaxID=208602 RepID=UPI0009FF22BB|nr:serine/threonine dehydratase [Nocardia puris]MBF6211942.1 serine/threonine dehydratase [Nocardia puris]MBF6366968.1 serine/threonine dehydratase [Nocardia puris]MBF6462055.1 serine/threonine dehydratase [Nocardia puris]